MHLPVPYQGSLGAVNDHQCRARKRRSQKLTAVDAVVVGNVVLRQLAGVGGDLDLKESDVARLVFGQVLLHVEGSETGHLLGLLSSEGVEAVNALLLEVVGAHSADAVVRLIKCVDDVAEGGALRAGGGVLGSVGRHLE